MKLRKFIKGVVFSSLSVVLISSNVLATNLTDKNSFNLDVAAIEEKHIETTYQANLTPEEEAWLESLGITKTLDDVYAGYFEEVDVTQTVNKNVHPSMLLKCKDFESAKIIIENVNNFSINESSIYYSLLDENGITYKTDFNGENKKRLGNGDVLYAEVGCGNPYIAYKLKHYFSTADTSEVYVFNTETKKSTKLAEEEKNNRALSGYFSNGHMFVADISLGPSLDTSLEPRHYVYGEDTSLKLGYYIVNDDLSLSKLPCTNSILTCTNDYIYYVPFSNETQELWVCNIDGTNARKIRDMSVGDACVYNNKVYLLRKGYYTEGGEVPSGVYVMNPDGSDLKPLIEFKTNKKRIDKNKYSYTRIECEESIQVLDGYIYFLANCDEGIVTEKHTGNEDDDVVTYGKECGNTIYRIKMDGTGLEKVVAQKTNIDGKEYWLRQLVSNGKDLFFEVETIKNTAEPGRTWDLYKLTHKK